MNYKYPEYKYPTGTSNALGLLGGMLIGALIGAVMMLLLAPQSGNDTRRQIQKKGLELRNRANGMVEDTLTQVRSKAKKISVGLKDRGQEAVLEQLENVSEAAQAGKKAIRSS